MSQKSGYSEGFNTQPPEGGWAVFSDARWAVYGFNTQPPEGGWGSLRAARIFSKCFNTQPPEGGWDLEADGVGVVDLFQHTAA